MSQHPSRDEHDEHDGQAGHEQAGPSGRDEPDAQPAEPSPRQQANVRDMAFAVLLLVAVVGLIVTVTRGCEFSPSGPSVDRGAAPSIDAGQRLRDVARSVDFPVRHPRLAENWQANSTRTEPIGTGAQATVFTEVGWLTGKGAYLRLLQSPASPRLLVDKVAEREGAGDSARGSVDVGTVRWAVYPGHGRERSWVGEFAGVTVLISGSAGAEEFRELATAVQNARPLPR